MYSIVLSAGSWNLTVRIDYSIIQTRNAMWEFKISTLQKVATIIAN